jgi:hypothetical protein
VAAGAGADHSFGRLWELVMARTTELVVFLAGLLLSAAAEEAETYALTPAAGDDVRTHRRWLRVAAVVVCPPAVLGALALHCLRLACCCCCGGAAAGEKCKIIRTCTVYVYTPYIRTRILLYAIR